MKRTYLMPLHFFVVRKMKPVRPNYSSTPMSVEKARNILKQGQVFGYLKGRPLHIDLEDNIVAVYGYNLDNGRGLAQRVI